MSDQFSAAARSMGEQSRDMGDQARDMARSASDTAERMKNEAAYQAGYQMDRLESAIRRNPMAAVGMAAGVGMLLALIARR